MAETNVSHEFGREPGFSSLVSDPECSHMLHVPYWLLWRPFNLILSLCTQLSPFKTIWPDFYIVYPNESFQEHLTKFYHCVPNWLLSRPYLPKVTVFARLCGFLSLKKLESCWLVLNSLMQNHCFCCILYPIASFQDHLTQFYHCVPDWLLSRPFYQIILSLVTRLTL